MWKIDGGFGKADKSHVIEKFVEKNHSWCLRLMLENWVCN